MNSKQQQPKNMALIWGLITDLQLMGQWIQAAILLLIGNILDLLSIGTFVAFGFLMLTGDTLNIRGIGGFSLDLGSDSTYLSVLVLGVVIVRAVVFFLGRIYFGNAVSGAEYNIRKELLHLISGSGKEVYFKLGAATVQHAFTVLPGQIASRGVANSLMVVSDTALLVIFSISVAFMLGLKSVLFGIGILPVVWIWLRLTRLGFQRRSLEVNNRLKQILARLSHFSAGIVDFIGFNKVNELATGLTDDALNVKRLQVVDIVVGSTPKLIIESILLTLIIVLVFFSEAVFGDKSSATLILGLIAGSTIKLAPICIRLGNQLGQLFSAIPLVAEFNDLRQQIKTESTEFTQFCTIGERVGSEVLLNKVAVFADDRLQIRRVNYSFSRGHLCLIRGRSGIGKSQTLSSIIVSASGSHSVAPASQSTIIVDGSLKDNLWFGRPDHSVSEIDKIILESNLYKRLLTEFPNGLDAGIQVGGTNISGGQARRIGVLRSLLSNRLLQVYDEPDSGLNYEAICDLLELVEIVRKHFVFVVSSHSDCFDTLADETIDLGSIV